MVVQKLFKKNKKVSVTYIGKDVFNKIDNALILHHYKKISTR